MNVQIDDDLDQVFRNHTSSLLSASEGLKEGIKAILSKTLEGNANLRKNLESVNGEVSTLKKQVSEQNHYIEILFKQMSEMESSFMDFVTETKVEIENLKKQNETPNGSGRKSEKRAEILWQTPNPK